MLLAVCVAGWCTLIRALGDLLECWRLGSTPAHRTGVSLSPSSVPSDPSDWYTTRNMQHIVHLHYRHFVICLGLTTDCLFITGTNKCGASSRIQGVFVNSCL